MVSISLLILRARFEVLTRSVALYLPPVLGKTILAAACVVLEGLCTAVGGRKRLLL